MHRSEREELRGVLAERAARVRARRNARAASGLGAECAHAATLVDRFGHVQAYCPTDPDYALARLVQQKAGYPPMSGNEEECPPGMISVVLGWCGSNKRLYGCVTDAEFEACGKRIVRAVVEGQSGLGLTPAELSQLPVPGAMSRYLATGAPMPGWKRDLGAATAQVPRWLYGVGALGALYFASRAYRKWRDG